MRISIYRRGTHLACLAGAVACVLAAGSAANAAIGGTDLVVGVQGLGGSDLAVLGIVETVDKTSGTLVVSGQSVLISSKTEGAEALPAKGALVAVYGSLGADGTIAAAQIKTVNQSYVPGASTLYVRGVVKSVNPALAKAQVGGLSIDYSASLYDTSAASIQVGSVAEFAGLQTSATLFASRAIGGTDKSAKPAAIGGTDRRAAVALPAAIGGTDKVAKPAAIGGTDRRAVVALPAAIGGTDKIAKPAAIGGTDRRAVVALPAAIGGTDKVAKPAAIGGTDRRAAVALPAAIGGTDKVAKPAAIGGTDRRAVVALPAAIGGTDKVAKPAAIGGTDRRAVVALPAAIGGTDKVAKPAAIGGTGQSCPSLLRSAGRIGVRR